MPWGAGVLEERRVLATRDVDRAHAFMQSKEFHLDLHPRAARNFDFAAKALYLPNSYLGSVQYGSPVHVRVPAERRRDDYFLHFPLRGSAEVSNATGDTLCGARQGVVSSPAGHLMRSAQGSARLTVSLTKSALAAQLAALMGDAPKEPIEFSPAIDLDSADGRRIERHVRLAIAELDDPASESSPSLLGLYEQGIMTALLLHQPSNCTDALHRLDTAVAPGGVRRAIDYMHGHLDAAITLADIIAAAGVPGRTLLQHFKDHRGTSPMRYLRAARLARVRDALLRGEADSVTDAAMAWGFGHPGRFAIEYRKLFGESPSQTWRRGPRRDERVAQPARRSPDDET